MSAKLLLIWFLVLLAGCAPSALGPLVVDGQELRRALARGRARLIRIR